MLGELDHLTCQQRERPACAPLRRFGAGGRDQQSLFLAGELTRRARARLFAQRQLKIAFDEAALGGVSV
jgi:hypothetical protein